MEGEPLLTCPAAMAYAPPMRLALLAILLLGSLALAQKSTVRVQCVEDCKVKLDGTYGLRSDSRRWEFRYVSAGSHRVEATGLLDRPLFTGFAEVPAATAITFQVQPKRLVKMSAEPLAAAPARESSSALPADAGAAPAPGAGPARAEPVPVTSRLHVRCDRPCSVTVDGLRKGSTGSGVSIELPAGVHQIEARSQLNEVIGRGSVEVPPASEVFTLAGKQEVRVINVKPLAP